MRGWYGTGRCGSGWAADDPLVDPAYFADPEDMDMMIASVELARRTVDGSVCRKGPA